MSENKSNHGGYRPNSGRKPKSTEEELRRLFDESWTLEERKAHLERMKEIALNTVDNKSAIAAWKALMAYRFGTPRSGDELRTEEAVDDALENQLTQLEANLTPSAWREVEVALGIESGGEEEASESGDGDFEESQE